MYLYYLRTPVAVLSKNIASRARNPQGLWRVKEIGFFLSLGGVVSTVVFMALMALVNQMPVWFKAGKSAHCATFWRTLRRLPQYSLKRISNLLA